MLTVKVAYLLSIKFVNTKQSVLMLINDVDNLSLSESLSLHSDSLDSSDGLLPLLKSISLNLENLRKGFIK